MAFNKRVGMEPASDLKKRIKSLCEEAGFIVGESHMTMFREETLQESVRYVFASVHEPDWNPEPDESYVGTDFEKHTKEGQIEIRARIGCDGSYDGTVHLGCMATDQIGEVFVPTLRDCDVPIADLPHWLVEIARQQREVIAARKRGERGPWQFGELQWKEWTGGLSS